MVKKATFRRWSPSNETIEAMGTALCSHWLASHAIAHSPFWPRPLSWLHHLTSGGRLMRYASGSASVPNPNLVPRS